MKGINGSISIIDSQEGAHTQAPQGKGVFTIYREMGLRGLYQKLILI
jgi:hypothetical protein